MVSSVLNLASIKMLGSVKHNILLRDRKTEITYGIGIVTSDICMPNPLLKTISS